MTDQQKIQILVQTLRSIQVFLQVGIESGVSVHPSADKALLYSIELTFKDVGVENGKKEATITGIDRRRNPKGEGV